MGRKVSLAATATALFVPKKAAPAAGSAWTTAAQPREKAGIATTRNPGPIYLTPKDLVSLTAPALLLKDLPFRILPVAAATQSQQVLLQPAQQLHLQLATLPVQQQSNALLHFQGLRDSASGVSAVQKVLPSLSSTWNTLAARLLQSLASPLFVTVRVVPAAQNATTSPAHQRVKAGTATTRRLRLHFLKALPALMMVLVVEFQDIHQ